MWDFGVISSSMLEVSALIDQASIAGIFAIQCEALESAIDSNGFYLRRSTNSELQLGR